MSASTGTLRIAVTGVDGSGKTTVIREISRRYAAREAEAIAVRAPQYHETPGLPFADLSISIQELNRIADEEGDIPLKASALFLSMTLYGDVESHFVGAHGPRVLVSERQCLADSLAYSRFYFPLLSRIPGGPVPSPRALARVTPGDRARIDAWLEVIRLREPLGRHALALPGAAAYALELFSRPAAELLPVLKKVYRAEIPDRLVILRLDPSKIASRVEGRSGASRGTELHEKAEVLARLQDALIAGSNALRGAKPSLQVETLDVTGQTVDETVSAVLRITGLE